MASRLVSQYPRLILHTRHRLFCGKSTSSAGGPLLVWA